LGVAGKDKGRRPSKKKGDCEGGEKKNRCDQHRKIRIEGQGGKEKNRPFNGNERYGRRRKKAVKSKKRGWMKTEEKAGAGRHR